MENTAAVKKKQKTKQMLLFTDTESIMQPPPLCDLLLRATGQEGEKKEKKTYSSFEWNLICSPTAAAWKLQATWNIQQIFLPERNPETSQWFPNIRC